MLRLGLRRDGTGNDLGEPAGVNPENPTVMSFWIRLAVSAGSSVAKVIAFLSICWKTGLECVFEVFQKRI